MVAQSAEFKKAVEDSRSLTKTPTNDELLEVSNYLTLPPTICAPLTVFLTPLIYALFKQGSGDVKFDDAPKPGMFDLKV